MRGKKENRREKGKTMMTEYLSVNLRTVGGDAACGDRLEIARCGETVSGRAE